jgi:catechol 2,3-dioxygenase-like lactoylglutathione lyase family enzyme
MIDMRLEVHVIPVTDVERSKQFYERLGWRFDADLAPRRTFASSSTHLRAPVVPSPSARE